MWPSHWEILIIFVVVLLLFGAKRIPEMAQGLGKGIREFRKAMKDVQNDIDVSESNTIAPKPEASAEQVARDTATADSSVETAPPLQQEKQTPK